MFMNLSHFLRFACWNFNKQNFPIKNAQNKFYITRIGPNAEKLDRNELFSV